MRMIVLLVVVLAACGGQPGADDPVMESPTGDPPPATEDGATLTGVLGGDAQLEGGCAWIDDGEQRWEVQYPEGYSVSFDPVTLTGPDGDTATEGDTVTVTGAPQTDVVTICQVGPVFAATGVELGKS